MKIHKCNFCHYKTNNFHNLARHSLNIHKVWSVLKCKVCSEAFQGLKLYQQHIQLSECANVMSTVDKRSQVPSKDSEELEEHNIPPITCNSDAINNDSVEQKPDVTGSGENLNPTIKQLPKAEPVKVSVKKESCEIYSTEKYETILLWNKQLIPEIKLERLRTDDDIKIFARWLLRNELKAETSEISNSSPSGIKDNLFDCNYCDRQFAFRRYLRIHVKQCHQNSIKRPVRFSSRPRISGKNKNLAGRKIDGSSAGVTTKPIATMKEVEQRCPECKTLCSSEEALTNHMKRHKFKKVVPDEKKESENNEIQVKGNSEKQPSIRRTVRKRKRKSSMSTEVKETRKQRKTKDSNIAAPLTPTLKIFECDTCNYVTQKRYRLTYHQKMHNTKRSITKSVSCQFCNYKTIGNYRLKTHLWHNHKNKDLKFKILKCELCDFCTVTKDLLRTHMKRKHKVILGFSCNKCNEKFPSMYEFKCHQWKQLKENKSCVSLPTDLTKPENLNA